MTICMSRRLASEQIVRVASPYRSRGMLDELLQPSLVELVVCLAVLWHLLLGHDRGFRRLALRTHPERLAADLEECECDAALEAFASVCEAYDVLSDPLKRAVFDQYRNKGLKNGARVSDGCLEPYVYHGEPLRTYREFFGTDNPYADILDHFAVPPPKTPCPDTEGFKKKDEPVVKRLPLTLQEIFYGGIKKMKIQKMVLVGGREEGSVPTVVPEEKILSIPVMPGMPSGARVVFPEEGDQSPTNVPADIIFVTEDRPDKTFKRQGSDLRMTVDVFLNEALTGTIITVPTVDDRTLRVPITSVIRPGYEKRIIGEGLPKVEDRDSRGDLIIEFNIEFPSYLSPASKILVNKAFEFEDDGAADGLADNPRRMVMDGKTYMRANKLHQICRH